MSLHLILVYACNKEPKHPPPIYSLERIEKPAGCCWHRLTGLVFLCDLARIEAHTSALACPYIISSAPEEILAGEIRGRGPGLFTVGFWAAIRTCATWPSGDLTTRPTARRLPRLPPVMAPLFPLHQLRPPSSLICPPPVVLFAVLAA